MAKATKSPSSTPAVVAAPHSSGSIGGSTSSARSTPAAPSAPSLESISRRAYEIFQARGGVDGHDQEDWMQAERELRLGRQ